jgi:outer membrane protein assembly factor BamD (BamD/ComL family)
VATPPATTATAPAPSEDPLALEVRWLDRARALLASDPTAALAHAEAYAQRFPGGALGAERELIAIDALQRMGRASEARARADAFAQHHPGSLYRERLQHLLRATAR